MLNINYWVENNRNKGSLIILVILYRFIVNDNRWFLKLSFLGFFMKFLLFIFLLYLVLICFYLVDME